MTLRSAVKELLQAAKECLWVDPASAGYERVEQQCCRTLVVVHAEPAPEVATAPAVVG